MEEVVYNSHGDTVINMFCSQSIYWWLSSLVIKSGLNSIRLILDLINFTWKLPPIFLNLHSGSDFSTLSLLSSLCITSLSSYQAHILSYLNSLIPLSLTSPPPSRSSTLIRYASRTPAFLNCIFNPLTLANYHPSFFTDSIPPNLALILLIIL